MIAPSSKARQGKATIDIIDARTEDWIGQFISNPLCNKKTAI